jgi:hypothetical protein
MATSTETDRWSLQGLETRRAAHARRSPLTTPPPHDSCVVAVVAQCRRVTDSLLALAVSWVAGSASESDSRLRACGG